MKQKTTFASMCLVLKTSWHLQSTFPIKNLKIAWICCLQLVKSTHIMCTSKILTDSCFTKQKPKTKNTFERVAYNALVVKMYIDRT